MSVAELQAEVRQLEQRMRWERLAVERSAERSAEEGPVGGWISEEYGSFLPPWQPERSP